MPNLILVPTPMELDIVRAHLEAPLHQWAFQLCGFGPVTSAARTSALVHRYQPERMMLIGIAGTYDADRLPIGTAARFDEVRCHGIGVGSGESFRSAQDLGWDQFSGDDAEPHIKDALTLQSSFVPDIPAGGLLVSASAASDSLEEAERRRGVYANAVAEEMEGFSVAVASAMASVPLQIVRGISNLAGDRDHDRWNIDAALKAACDLALQLADRPWLPDRIE